MQENIKARKEMLRVAHEEIKKLRAVLVQDGELNKSHVLSSESLEEARNLEPQEICLRRATASERKAGASRDGASWFVEADRIALDISGKKREGFEKETTKDDIAWTDWMALCHREGASVDIASNIRVGTCC